MRRKFLCFVGLVSILGCEPPYEQPEPEKPMYYIVKQDGKVWNTLKLNFDEDNYVFNSIENEDVTLSAYDCEVYEIF